MSACFRFHASFQQEVWVYLYGHVLYATCTVMFCMLSVSLLKCECLESSKFKVSLPPSWDMLRVYRHECMYTQLYYTVCNEKKKLQITSESLKTESSKFEWLQMCSGEWMGIGLACDQMFCICDVFDRSSAVLTSAIKSRYSKVSDQFLSGCCACSHFLGDLILPGLACWQYIMVTICPPEQVAGGVAHVDSILVCYGLRCPHPSKSCLPSSAYSCDPQT